MGLFIQGGQLTPARCWYVVLLGRYTDKDHKGVLGLSRIHQSNYGTLQ